MLNLTPAQRAKIRRQRYATPWYDETKLALALVYGIVIPGLLVILALPFFR